MIVFEKTGGERKGHTEKIVRLKSRKTKGQ